MKQPGRALSLGLSALLYLFFLNPVACADSIYAAYYYGGTIMKFDASGNGTLFASGLNSPWGIALDSSGNVYVSEENAGRIDKFDAHGNKSVFASGLFDVTGLAFDSSGNLYAAQWYNSGSILKFDSSGHPSTFLSALPEPINLAFDSSNNLYVANWYGGIQKFSSTGKLLTTWSGGPPNPYGLAFDKSGNAYASFVNNGAIEILNSNGTMSLFASTSPPNPYGIAFDSSGNLYAANFGWGNGSIEKFNPSGVGTTFSSGLGDPSGGIAILIPEPATWILVVLGGGMVVGIRRLRCYYRVHLVS